MRKKTKQKKAAKKRTPAKKTSVEIFGKKKPAKKVAAKKRKKTSKSPAGSKKSFALSRAEINQIARELEKTKSDISRDISKKKQYDSVKHDIGDPIDTANENLDKEIFFEISSNEISLLTNIEAALRKIDKGIYGICEKCNRPIPKKRLKSIPHVRYCINCQNISEKSAAF